MITRYDMLRAWTAYFDARGRSESLAFIEQLRADLRARLVVAGRRGRRDGVTTVQGIAYGVLGQCQHAVNRRPGV